MTVIERIEIAEQLLKNGIISSPKEYMLFLSTGLTQEQIDKMNEIDKILYGVIK